MEEMTDLIRRINSATVIGFLVLAPLIVLLWTLTGAMIYSILMGVAI